jgi:hypothetical protein
VRAEHPQVPAVPEAVGAGYDLFEKCAQHERGPL